MDARRSIIAVALTAACSVAATAAPALAAPRSDPDSAICWYSEENDDGTYSGWGLCLYDADHGELCVKILGEELCIDW